MGARCVSDQNVGATEVREARLRGEVCNPCLVGDSVEREGARARVRHGPAYGEDDGTVVEQRPVRSGPDVARLEGRRKGRGRKGLCDGEICDHGSGHREQQDGRRDRDQKPGEVIEPREIPGCAGPPRHGPPRLAAGDSGPGWRAARGGSVSLPLLISSAKWHSATWPGESSIRGGAAVLQMS